LNKLWNECSQSIGRLFTFASMDLKTSRIQALIELIDDPDLKIYNQVKSEIIRMGKPAVHILQHSFYNPISSPLFFQRIEEIIREIQLKSLRSTFLTWRNSTEKQLLDGMILLALFQEPELEKQEIEKQIQEIKQAVWLEMNPKLTAFEQIKVFNHVFFSIIGFKGIQPIDDHPATCNINQVLLTKSGNPVSLSLLYSIIAQSLGLEIYGVNLPNHFILAYMDGNSSFIRNSIKNEFGVLFYINAFNSGSLHTAEAIQNYLDLWKISPHRSYFEPCSNTESIRRLMNHNITVLEQHHKFVEAKQLIELRNTLTESCQDFKINR
jgi:regulator of sirC expression with transglutaminase-like and TPR domain